MHETPISYQIDIDSIDRMLNEKKTALITMRVPGGWDEMLADLAKRAGMTRSSMCLSLIAYAIMKQGPNGTPGTPILVLHMEEAAREARQHITNGTWNHVTRQHVIQALVDSISEILAA